MAGAEGFQTPSFRVRRVTGALVGRPAEAEAIRRELDRASEGLVGITFEGEPGIGKTRLLLTAEEMAISDGFRVLSSTADEEIGGPFFLARGLFSTPSALRANEGSAARESIGHAIDALSGHDDPSLATLSGDRRVLRTFDLAAVAIRALADECPLAILLDDVQWADTDSLRLFRYLVRTMAASSIFLAMAFRTDEAPALGEATTLVADMERMGILRRLKLARLSPVETAEMLRQMLGDPVEPAGATTIHAQAEGVPFVIEEVARAYLDAGMLQRIEGRWRLARNAERLLPSSVRTLIQRRAGHVPDDTRRALSEAAVLGRSFSLRDITAVRARLDDTERDDPDVIAESLRPAVAAGLVVQLPDEANADYRFSHEQIREFSASELSAPRRRAIHGIIVDLLMGDGDPSEESLPLLAHHALASGDTGRATQLSVRAASSALRSHAAEEALRLVDRAMPAASEAADRVALLRLRDAALEMLRRPAERLESLSEMAALAQASGDDRLALEVMLRRSAAFRLSDDCDRAAELARRVRGLSVEHADGEMELKAAVELGQDLLRSGLGEAYVPAASDVDLDGAEESFLRAAELAESSGDDAVLAACLRELGVIDVARIRMWFVERIMSFEHLPILQRIAAGELPEAILPELPIAPDFMRASERFQRAYDIFDRIGDRRGAMSSIISMAYLTFGPEIHLGPTAGRRIEELRRLATKARTLTTESERALAEAQMLYGVHLFARTKVIPDLALARGREAYEQARTIGDGGIEFLAAGGVAAILIDVGSPDEAGEWLQRAAAVAGASPTPRRAYLLELWRGLARAAAGDVPGMRGHLERAVRLATEQGRASMRCEALAAFALAGVPLALAAGDADLLVSCERAANEAKDLRALLPGSPVWGAQADAALAQIAAARDDVEGALASARAAMAAMMESHQEDPHFEVVLPVAGITLAHGLPEEQQMVGGFLRIQSAMIAQRTTDEDVRVRWFAGPVGRQLVALAGTLGDQADVRLAGDGLALDEEEMKMLHMISQAYTNAEIAASLGVEESVVVRRLREMFAKIGASSRGEATLFAFMSRSA